jgi:3-hydroxy acid dehydrogenase / malonic semialdehyde reductase
MQSVKNKLVLITGATAGIGKACATIFAQNGANLILLARRENLLNELQQSLHSEFGVRVITLVCDIRNSSEVKKSFASLSESDKKIDILINNAGMARGIDKLQDGLIENWDEMIDTNLKGLLYITREVVPFMIEFKKGIAHIINLGSTAGHEVYPGGNVYCATKFAVKAITKSLRLELLEHQIKVSTVDPGMVETDFSYVRFPNDSTRAKNVYSGLTPLVAEDIAETVLFCATRPHHVNINEMVITPTAQASSNFIIRK